MKRKSISYAKWGYIFLIPFFVVYIIFSLYPLFQTFYYSFTDYVKDQGSIGGGWTRQAVEVTPTFCGFDNYSTIFTSGSDLLQSFWNTIIMWIVGFIPQIVISLILAVWFTDLRLKIKAQGFFKAVIYLPNVIMASAFAFLFYSLFSRGGAIYDLIKVPLLESVWGSRGVVGLINFILWYGNTTILLMAAIMGVDTSLYESAQIDGATSSQTFWKITIPLIKPIMSYVLVTSLIGGLQMYDVPALLTKDMGSPNGKLKTVVMIIQANKQGDIGKAMTVFADSRSALRAVIGYLDAGSISEQQEIYFDKRDSFTTYFNSITEQCNYSEAKKICDNISSVIDDYWTLSDEIIRQGATSDVNASNNAQRLEMNKLTPEYDTIYGLSLIHI